MISSHGLLKITLGGVAWKLEGGHERCLGSQRFFVAGNVIYKYDGFSTTLSLPGLGIYRIYYGYIYMFAC